MNFLSMFGMVVLLISLLIKVMMLMVSKACEKSIATSAVRRGGLFWLKPVRMGSIMECSAVVVECLDLKPC